MKRRLFVKKASMLTTGILALSGINALASHVEKSNPNYIDLSPISPSNKKIKLIGFVLDSKTLEPITDIIRMKVAIKRNRFFSLKESIETKNSSYTIVNGLTKSGKIFEKMNVAIHVNGYKPYHGAIFMTQNGCNVHSEEWNYNENFKPEYCPKNYCLNDNLQSKFNFLLVKL